METSEINYGDIVLYEKYVPELDCYRLAVKRRCSKLSFPQDFAKPERPGTKRRSKPSDLKPKSPKPIPEPVVQEPVPQEPPRKQSFLDNLCALCCCCCAPSEKGGGASAASVNEIESPSDEQEPYEPTLELPPKPQKGILKTGSSSMEDKVIPTKSVSIIVPETEDSIPPSPSEPLAPDTPDADISQPPAVNTDYGMETGVITSYTATTTVVAVGSEPLTTIFRCEEISSMIDTSISQPTSERTELQSDIQPTVEASSLPTTSPKLEEDSPVVTGVGGPDKVAKERPGTETEMGKSIPTKPPETSQPEPTTGSRPSQSAPEETEQGSQGDEFLMEGAASLPDTPSRSVLPRPHKASRRYFSLAAPATPQQKECAARRTAPLPGPNWIHKIL